MICYFLKVGTWFSLSCFHRLELLLYFNQSLCTYMSNMCATCMYVYSLVGYSCFSRYQTRDVSGKRANTAWELYILDLGLCRCNQQGHFILSGERGWWCVLNNISICSTKCKFLGVIICVLWWKPQLTLYQDLTCRTQKVNIYYWSFNFFFNIIMHGSVSVDLQIYRSSF